MSSAAEQVEAEPDVARNEIGAHAALGSGYRRREPERTVLHSVVREHLATFLVEAEERSSSGHGLLGFVREEFERYLRCGILAHRFARVRCAACGDELLVAFSCKGRGFCPSCTTRRMHDTAAHLVDHVLPRAPMRQWVLSLPRWARWLLARDPSLISRTLDVVLREICKSLRRRARRAGVCSPQAGAITFIQYFGGALNLNVHFHCIIPDGVFERECGEVRFVQLGAPTDDEIGAVLRRIVARLMRMLRPRAAAAEADASPLDALGLAQSESLQLQLTAPPAPVRAKKRTAFLDGFSLHAGVHLHANDREGLEHLCGYGARPPLSLDRLAALPDGRLTYSLKRPRGDGPKMLTLQPTEFLRRLATLVPPPRRHLVRYHGVFAPNSTWRSEVIRLAADERAKPDCANESIPPVTQPRAAVSSESPAPRRSLSRIPWSELLLRVFREDVLLCPCGGRRVVLAFLTERKTVRAILEHLNLPITGPPIAPARVRDAAGVELWQDDVPALQQSLR